MDENKHETEEKKFEWGELIIPILAIFYVAYTILDQYFKGIRSSSLKYGLVLAVPLVVLSIVDLAKFFYVKASGKISPCEGITGGIKTMLIVILGVIGTIALMSLIGYMPAFFLFLVFTFWGLGIRSPKIILAVSIIFLLFIYGAFDFYLQLDLPQGLIMKFFN